MGSLGAMLRHPDDVYPLLKLKMAMKHAEKQIPPEPHWAFCYTMLHKVSRSFGLVIQQLDTNLRNALSLLMRRANLEQSLTEPNASWCRVACNFYKT